MYYFNTRRNGSCVRIVKNKYLETLNLLGIYRCVSGYGEGQARSRRLGRRHGQRAGPRQDLARGRMMAFSTRLSSGHPLFIAAPLLCVQNCGKAFASVHRYLHPYSPTSKLQRLPKLHDGRVIRLRTRPVPSPSPLQPPPIPSLTLFPQAFFPFKAFPARTHPDTRPPAQ